MIDQAIYRRFNHTVAACFVIYFLFPEHIFGYSRLYLVLLFWLGIILIEYFRLSGSFVLDGMRGYESKRIAGFVWVASGTCLIFIFYEMGVVPEIFAVSTIIMASFVDPIIGEFNKRYGNVYGVFAGLISSIVIYQLIIGVFFYAFVSVLGLAIIIINSPKVFFTIQLMGSILLIWIGYKTIKDNKIGFH